MTNFRKIAAGFLSALLLITPCYVFADELSEGECVSESFSMAEEGTDFWELGEYIKETSEMFSNYRANTTKAMYIDLPGIGSKPYYSIISPDVEEGARNLKASSTDGDYAINDANSTAKIADGSFRIDKTTNSTYRWQHTFSLKNPMESGVYRLSFVLDKPYAISSYGNRFIYIYDFEPDENFYCSTSGYGNTPITVGFNENLLFFSGNYNPATGTAESWQTGPSASFNPGKYNVDIIIDADNKRVNFFVNDSFLRSALYTGDAIRSISLVGGQDSPWKGPDGGEGVFVFDDFEQERLVSPTYSLNIADGAYDVPVDTEPALSFATPVEKNLAEQIIIYKDGKVLENIERQLSEDGTTITFNMDFDYSAEYKFEVPNGNRAINRAPIIESAVKFRTEHKPTNVVVENETKPEYVAGEDYTATVTLTNTSAVSVKATYVVAFYDSEGRMFNIDYTVAMLAANAKETPVSVKLSASDKEGVTVKTFLIDALQTMNPLVTAID